ncbi:SDR family NAD(P)-dependent oxidoreductase [Priestia koreensis]|uniref:SDR family NAD(P)-dependent oxidoreductase n=1 Tax=Priestia koreensis TaxID=284581 RepID=UPI001F5AFB86|nr:SDR family NAD(P)-dependent oxidoreductase [Priestia koreensis]UNL86787.1 SDR family oxidoreductase [Priestia koreensis]
MKLKNKIAIVTGGTKGLGKAIAIGFLKEGATVICAGRQPYDFDKFSDPFPKQASYHEVDVRNPNSVKELVDKCVRVYGKIDIMVANAGILRDSTLVKMSYNQWFDSIDTNLNGVFNCTHAVIPHMIEKGGGHIINISSAAASRVNIGQANYCASKAGVEMFTKVAATELGPKGIMVNCLSPGIIEAGMGEKLRENEFIWKKYTKRMSLRRPGTGEEVAQAALFLATESSSYVNGHVLEVNGGLLWA